MKKFTIEQAIAMIIELPCMYAKGGRAWHINVKTVAYVACALITADSTSKAIDEVSRKARVSMSTLSYFIKGQTTQGAKWPELRAAMTASGVAWHVPPRERREMDAAKAVAEARAAALAATPPKAVAPTVDAGTPQTKAATLAVGPNGMVTIAAPPLAATAPPAMVARPVAPCTKDTTTSPRNWRIDPETQDIIVTTTTRYAYGSAEHRAKLMQIAHGLGVATPTTSAGKAQ